MHTQLRVRFGFRTQHVGEHLGSDDTQLAEFRTSVHCSLVQLSQFAGHFAHFFLLFTPKPEKHCTPKERWGVAKIPATAMSQWQRNAGHAPVTSVHSFFSLQSTQSFGHSMHLPELVLP